MNVNRNMQNLTVRDVTYYTDFFYFLMSVHIYVSSVGPVQIYANMVGPLTRKYPFAISSNEFCD